MDLPCFIFLKGQDQNNPADQTGQTDELLALDVEGAVHEQHLPRIRKMEKAMITILRMARFDEPLNKPRMEMSEKKMPTSVVIEFTFFHG